MTALTQPVLPSTEELAAAAAGQRVHSWLLTAVAERADATALHGADGSSYTWRQYADGVARLAGALQTLGVGAGDRVVLMLRNRPEFHLLDLAALMLRATPISVYNSSSTEQLRYLVGHCRAKLAVVDDLEFLGRLQAARGDLPLLEQVVVIDAGEAAPPAGVLRFSDLDGAPVDLHEAAAAAEPHDLITVIYTSGTTGNPKGVMLDHANVAWQSVAYSALLGEALEPGLRIVSYLPMAHIAERMVGHYGALYTRAEVFGCPDITELAGSLARVHPNSLFGSPRVWEKLHAGVRAAVAAGGGEAVQRFEQALAVGEKAADLRARGEELPAELAVAWQQVDAAAFAPLRERLGLDQLHYGFSGAAPLPQEVWRFFRAIGIPFSEIYGMSENTGGMTWDPFRVKIGTVGRPFPGTEVRLAADGEVLCRGGIVSRGYLDDPERTAETFDADGWLHSGDIGVFDDEGYLRIVDRKKELIITAGGKNVAPAVIEAEVKSVPLVGQACVVGDDRPFVVALCVLDPDVAPVWAAAHGIQRDVAGDLAALARDPAVVEEVRRGLAEVNSRFNRVEQVKRFALLGEEWLPDSDLLTATLKLKRRGVHARYAGVIEDLYAGGGTNVTT